jgi:septal ring factor EnvC (AmiA/AmiB activator)
MLPNMLASHGFCALVASLALGSTACVETGTYEKAQNQLEEAQRTEVQRNTEIRALQWQLASLRQQLGETEQRHDAWQRELHAQVQQFAAINAALTERLKKSESEHAALLLTVSAESQPTTPGHDPRADDLRRRMALDEARGAAILEQLGRIERLLTQSPPVTSRSSGEAGSHGGTATAGDVVDPWGGSRR